MIKHFKTAKGVFKAVDGVDVDIEPSSIVALLGPSGSGKTTLLRLIAGLEMPTGGRILFDDFDATYTPVQDRKIGFVFQSYALFNHKTVAENIKFGLEVGSWLTLPQRCCWHDSKHPAQYDMATCMLHATLLPGAQPEAGS
jgi:sulfate transport system ATP-binding protein